MKSPKEQAAELLKNSEIILGETQSVGTGQSEVCAQHKVELSVVYEGNDFSVSKSNTTSIYGIRTIVDGKLGFMTSNSSDEKVLREIAGENQKLAQLSVSSAHHRLAENPQSAGYFENYDPTLAALSPSELYPLLQQVVDEACQDEKVSLDRAEMAFSQQVTILRNSQGYSQQAAETNCSWFAMGMGKTDTEVSSFDYDGGSVWSRDHLEEAITQTMSRFRLSAVGSLNPQPAKDYKGMVLLHPAAVMGILGTAISFNANGKNHNDGISAWKDQMGKPVASEKLMAVEAPGDRNRPSGWAPFDREGIPTARHEIIQEGHLNFAAHHCFSAHQAGVSPTGNAVGGAGGLPQVGFSNFTLFGKEGHTVSEEELYEILGAGLVLKRFSGNCDPISGQFSGVAKNSWWVEGGQRSHAVQEVMVAGNAFDVLKQIVALGTPLHTNIGGSQAPYILVDGVSVTAG